MEIITRKQAIEQNLTHYFTGVPCKRGHIEKRRVNGGGCLGCDRMKHYTYYAANREQVLKQIGNWQKENKDKVQAASQRWRDNNPDTASQTTKRYYVKNKEKKLANNKIWRQHNKDIIRLYNTQRRDQLVLATPFWSDIEEIRKIYKKAVEIQEDTGIAMHVDHKIPLCHELVCGLHVPANLQIIEASANLNKGSKFNPEDENN